MPASLPSELCNFSIYLVSILFAEKLFSQMLTKIPIAPELGMSLVVGKHSRKLSLLLGHILYGSNFCHYSALTLSCPSNLGFFTDPSE